MGARSLCSSVVSSVLLLIHLSLLWVVIPAAVSKFYSAGEPFVLTLTVLSVFLPSNWHDKTNHYVPIPEPIIHTVIPLFIRISWLFVVLFPPRSARLSDVSFPYETVVEFCPRMAHQAMNTSLWRRKDERKRSDFTRLQSFYDTSRCMFGQEP